MSTYESMKKDVSELGLQWASASYAYTKTKGIRSKVQRAKKRTITIDAPWRRAPGTLPTERMEAPDSPPPAPKRRKAPKTPPMRRQRNDPRPDVASGPPPRRGAHGRRHNPLRRGLERERIMTPPPTGAIYRHTTPQSYPRQYARTWAKGGTHLWQR